MHAHRSSRRWDVSLNNILCRNPTARKTLTTSAALTSVSTRYWHALPDRRIQCDVCPRECKLHEGQRGLCFVRAREGDGIVLTSYGRSSGFCVDPIEKKPLNHFLPGTPVLSFGTAGCNLACKFCQNWDMSKSRHMDTLMDQAYPGTLAQTAERLGYGVHHAYPGNVRDEQGSNTWCHHCNALLIGRNGYRITAWNLTGDSSCPDCGTTLPGVFEARPGDWGERRMGVRIDGA